MGETAAADVTARNDDRVAASEHHGPEWPTHHVTVLFSRIAKSTGESLQRFPSATISRAAGHATRSNVIDGTRDDIDQTTVTEINRPRCREYRFLLTCRLFHRFD